MKKTKIVAGLLTLLFVLISACLMQPKGSEVMANNNSNTFHVEESLNISDYKTKNEDGTITSTIPKATGEYADWIFAGWYKDVDCTSAVGKNTIQGTYHAKFVPAEVLSIKCQTNANLASTDDTAKIRIISTVDSLKYSQVGFDLQFKGK